MGVAIGCVGRVTVFATFCLATFEPQAARTKAMKTNAVMVDFIENPFSMCSASVGSLSIPCHCGCGGTPGCRLWWACFVFLGMSVSSPAVLLSINQRQRDIEKMRQIGVYAGCPDTRREVFSVRHTEDTSFVRPVDRSEQQEYMAQSRDTCKIGHR